MKATARQNQVFNTDFAGDSRRAALAKMQRSMKQSRMAKQQSFFMVDQSGSDRRSVKAWLRG